MRLQSRYSMHIEVLGLYESNEVLSWYSGWEVGMSLLEQSLVSVSSGLVRQSESEATDLKSATCTE